MKINKNKIKIASLKMLIQTIKIKNGTNQEKEYKTLAIIYNLNKQRVKIRKTM
jgi:hypothetical protein